MRAKRETVNVSFRFDVAAHALLLQQAKAARMSTRAWLEAAVLNNKTEVHIPPDEDLARALLFQVGRAGNNLNQIAHKLNSLDMAGRLTPDRIEEGVAQLDAIQRLLRRAVARAGKN